MNINISSLYFLEMTFFLLPRSYNLLYTNIEYESIESIPISAISHSLSYYLYNIKEKITSKERPKKNNRPKKTLIKNEK
jgi:hypothetical protein